MTNYKFNTVEEALEDIRKGKMILAMPDITIEKEDIAIFASLED